MARQNESDGTAVSSRQRKQIWIFVTFVAIAFSTVIALVAIGLSGALRHHPGESRGEAISELPTVTVTKHPGTTAPNTPSPTPSTQKPGANAPESSADPTDGTMTLNPRNSGAITGSRTDAPVGQYWSDLRAQAGIPALSRTACLDQAADRYAQAAAQSGGVSGSPDVPDNSCGGNVRFGYMLGFDPSGAGQASASLTVTGTGSSPLMAADVRKFGYAITSTHGETGRVNGYILAWAVSR